MKFSKPVSKVLAILTAMVMVFSFGATYALAENMQTSLNEVTKSTVDVVEVTAELGENPDLSKLEWTFGDKMLSEWVIVDNGQDTEKPLITFSKKPYLKDGKVRAELRFDLAFAIDGEPTDDVSAPRSNRVRAYEDMGIQELKVTDTSTGNMASVEINYTPYKDFTAYDEIKPKLDKILSNNLNGYYTEYQSIGKSYEGRDLHFVIVAKDQAVVNNYLNNMPKVLEDPAKYQRMLDVGTLNQQVPIFINNIHPDEHPGVDAQFYVLEDILTKKKISYNSLDGEMKQEVVEIGGYPELARMKDSSRQYRVSIDVDELMDKVFFVFSLTENPDGRYHNTRQNARGFDVNRDNATQLQPESKALVEQIAKWSPVSFLDLHGFVDSFLFEPCTPPHDPNYEYDLFMSKALEHTNAMGKAAIANTSYDMYLIAQEGEANWDDGAPNYTATYAMHHGAMGTTIEMPDSNHESLKALSYACLESARYVAENYKEVYRNQLEYFKRGVEGIDSPAVDAWIVDKENVSLGRPRELGKSFFPDYYVIPYSEGVKGENEVTRLAEYLIRNGIKVSTLDKDATIDGNSYKAGDLVVDMKQAKRGLANAVLWKGPDVSSWSKDVTLGSGFQYEEIEMYAELVLNFPALRGFDCYSVYAPGAFEGKITQLTKAAVRKSTLPDSDYVSVANSSVDAIKAINSILWDGVPVYRSEDGSFIVPRSRGLALTAYNLELTAAEDISGAAKLRLPNVYAGQKTAKATMRQLGFKVVEDKEQADILIDDNGYITEEDFGKPIISLGKYALESLGETAEFEGMEFLNPYSDYEALIRININKDAPETVGYEGLEYGYLSTGSIITALPEGAQVQITTPNSNTFVSGWYPGNIALDGETFMFTKDVNGGKVTVIAGDVIRKEYNQGLYRLVTNAIYDSVK